MYPNDYYEIHFAPNQKLPPNYKVMRLGGHYVWELGPGPLESIIFVNRWDCWRSAWAHWRKHNEI